MTNSSMIEKVILQDLGDGLVLRRATPQDAQALGEFNARLHSDDGPDQPDERIGMWTRDLISGGHPTVDPGDSTIVEDTTRGKIVSSVCLIPETWSYGGIPISVGRLELVATDPEYRNRGLVRLQFDTIHQWCAQRGDVLQAVTGIPYYYRQFGYEMALDLDCGRVGYPVNVPELASQQPEPYQIRPARQDDLAFIANLYENACQRYLVHSMFDLAMWQYELDGRSAQNIVRLEWCMIETPDCAPVGFLAHPHFLWTRGSMMTAMAYEVAAGYSWAAVTPTVIRYLAATGREYAARQPGKTFGAFCFWLGREHPIYEVARERTPRFRKPYAWYIRVPDLPGFLHQVAPVLERSLQDSAFAAYTGEIKITFYRSGLKLTFVSGRLSDVQAWKPEPQGESGDAGFPDLTFLQLLMGYRSLEELEYAFPDCWCSNDEARGLLNALFPKRLSHVLPVA